jgi:WD40 repeat protein
LWGNSCSCSTQSVGSKSRDALLGRFIGVRELGGEGSGGSAMRCEKVDDQLDRITAMAMSNNRQCLALACKYRGDHSAYIFFYDLLQLPALRRIGKSVHEGTPTDEEERSFVSISFSPEAKYIAVLTNIKDGSARLYEWKKDVRVIATTSWLSELNKEARGTVNAEISKITIDPNNKDQVCMSGKGHLRIWRNQGNILKPLPPILSLDQTKWYTDHAWLEGGWLVGGTDKGELCFVYENRQCVMEAAGFGGVVDAVSCLYPFGKGLLVGGSVGQLSVWEKKDTGNKELDEAQLKEVMQFQKNLSRSYD